MDQNDRSLEKGIIWPDFTNEFVDMAADVFFPQHQPLIVFCIMPKVFQ